MLTRATVPRRLDRSGVTMGVTAGVEKNGTQTEGGVSHATRCFFAVVVRVFRPSPSLPNRASGEGEDGSDPPSCAADAARRWGGWHQVYHLVYHPPTRRWWGRSRLNVSMLEGSDARPRRARDGRRVAR